MINRVRKKEGTCEQNNSKGPSSVCVRRNYSPEMKKRQAESEEDSLFTSKQTNKKTHSKSEQSFEEDVDERLYKDHTR